MSDKKNSLMAEVMTYMFLAICFMGLLWVLIEAAKLLSKSIFGQ
jgi:hypothetical protein